MKKRSILNSLWLTFVWPWQWLLCHAFEPKQQTKTTDTLRFIATADSKVFVVRWDGEGIDVVTAACLRFEQIVHVRHQGLGVYLVTCMGDGKDNGRRMIETLEERGHYGG